jgi:hypothetical protein
MWHNNYQVAGSARDFMYKVYGWMSAALVVTAAVAFYVASTPAIYMTLFKTPGLTLVLCMAQLGIVFFLGWKKDELSYSGMVAAFLMYAALTGITVSSVLLMYTLSSVFLAFGITSGMFFSMALYGYFTNADLSSLGNILLMGLWGLVIAMFANMWVGSFAMQYYISLAAVGIFTLLTAYDVQKLKHIANSMMIDPVSKQKIAVLGALTLYLDFINLFLHLVRLFGKRK